MAMAATSDKLADKKDDLVRVTLEAISNLPEDILEDILLRLPVRDLLRFRCVSKSLRALIDSPSFIRTHYSLQYAIHKARGDMPVLTWVRLGDVRVYPIECHLLSKDQHGDDTVLNRTSDIECFTNTNFLFSKDPDVRFTVRCGGSANGIICLAFEGLDVEGLGRDFYYSALWNPASREFKVVAYPHVPNQIIPGYFCVIGFVFDPLLNDFKILATTTVTLDIVFVFMVYTLSTNSWKRVCEPSLFGAHAYVNTSGTNACLNGVYYWTAGLSKPDNYKLFRILSFNLSTEVFTFSDPPEEALPVDHYIRSNEFYWNIGLYNECLALFITRNVHGMPEASAEIWVVSEFDNDSGVPLAWQCIIFIKPIYEQIGLMFGAPRMDGDFLFDIWSSGELTLYNPTTGNFRKLGIKILQCFSYVESLFPLSRRVVMG